MFVANAKALDLPPGFDLPIALALLKQNIQRCGHFVEAPHTAAIFALLHRAAMESQSVMETLADEKFVEGLASRMLNGDWPPSWPEWLERNPELWGYLSRSWYSASRHAAARVTTHLRATLSLSDPRAVKRLQDLQSDLASLPAEELLPAHICSEFNAVGEQFDASAFRALMEHFCDAILGLPPHAKPADEDDDDVF